MKSSIEGVDQDQSADTHEVANLHSIVGNPRCAPMKRGQGAVCFPSGDCVRSNSGACTLLVRWGSDFANSERLQNSLVKKGKWCEIGGLCRRQMPILILIRDCSGGRKFGNV